MSYKFDKSEVPQFHFVVDDWGPCVACKEDTYCDHDTGLCRSCWRVVILGPAMESWRNDHRPPLRPPGTRV